MQPSGVRCHDIVTEAMQPKMAFNKRKNYAKWKKDIKEKLIEVLGLKQIEKNACEPQLEIESEEQKDGYFVGYSENYLRVYAECDTLPADKVKVKVLSKTKDGVIAQII